MTADLFPETQGAEPAPPAWHGKLLNKWGDPRLTVRLIPVWDDGIGWACGWFAHADSCADEWTPHAPDAWRVHSHYPWHRPALMPGGRELAVALGSAAREVRIVLAQFRDYADADLHADLAAVSDAIEVQARAWLTGLASA